MDDLYNGIQNINTLVFPIQLNYVLFVIHIFICWEVFSGELFAGLGSILRYVYLAVDEKYRRVLIAVSKTVLLTAVDHSLYSPRGCGGENHSSRGWGATQLKYTNGWHAMLMADEARGEAWDEVRTGRP